MTDKLKLISRDAPNRTLSEEFHTQSPNTQSYIKTITGGVTPTSNSINGSSRITQKWSANIDRFNKASDYEKEMMFRHELIPPNSDVYRKYVKELNNNNKKKD